MAGYAQLPGYQTPNALNFDGLNQGIDAASKGIAQGRMNALNMDIGQRAAAGDWKGAANTAYGAGQIDTGMGMTKFKTQQDAAALEHEQKVAEKLAGISQMVLKAPPEQGRAMWQKMNQANPELAGHLAKYGVDPNDHVAASNFIIAERRGWVNPLDDRAKLAQINHAEGQNSMLPLDRQAKMLEVEAKRRDLNTPKDNLMKIGPDESVIRANPRGGPAEVVYGGAGANGQSSAFNKARDKELGESQAKAQMALPVVADSANRALAVIEEIRNHKGRGSATGLIGSIPAIPGTDARGFVNLVDQAKGQTFLEAFNSLKGGGAITEAEGQKATQALARLDRSQSKADFDAALNDLQRVITTGASRAARIAKGDLSAAPVAAPQPKAADFSPDKAPPGTVHNDPKWGKVVKGADGTWYPAGDQ